MNHYNLDCNEITICTKCMEIIKDDNNKDIIMDDPYISNFEKLLSSNNKIINLLDIVIHLLKHKK